jgi:hypothetical protein
VRVEAGRILPVVTLPSEYSTVVEPSNGFNLNSEIVLGIFVPILFIIQG